jgi:hypothetical protein
MVLILRGLEYIRNKLILTYIRFYITIYLEGVQKNQEILISI